MPSRRHQLILLRGEGPEVARWEVTGRRVAAGFGGAVAIAGLALLSGWLWFSARADRIELSRLQEENRLLRSSNETFEGRFSRLQERLADSEDRTRKLAIVAGAEGLSGGRELGLGGELRAAAGMEQALAGLEQRSELLAQNLERVETRVSDNFQLLSSTPSIWPVAGLLASGYGWRRDPFTGQRAYHDGIDIAAPPGRPIQAAAGGVVAKVLQYGGLGRAVYLSHGFGVTTVYGHMSRVLVRPGQRIERGETVGLVGNTGRATGYHLHYEVHIDGRSVSPLPYLLGSPLTRP
jgi:murein DD-endopeptidase MepM/ murein hydrolase activator NlpD